MLTKNAATTLSKTLDSIRSFPEVILLDTGSTDETLSLAKKYPNVKVFQTSFQGFGISRNQAAELASHDWILALDSDEVPSPSLLAEIARLPLNNTKCVYRILRRNFFNGKEIQGCGWQKEWVARLYCRKTTHYKEVQVHEALETEGLQVLDLAHPLSHTPYRSTSDFLLKMQQYSHLFALEHQSSKRSSFAHALFHACFAFCKSYLWQRGFLDGAEGFIISHYQGTTAFYKYLKLAEQNLSKKGEQAIEGKK